MSVMTTSWLISLVCPALAISGELDQHKTLVQGDEPIAVREQLVIAASEDGLLEESDPIELRVERSGDGRVRCDVRGFSIYIDETFLVFVHESNDEAFVRIAHDGKPMVVLREVFAEVPSLWLALACSRKDENALANLFRAVPDLHVVGATDDGRLELASRHASGWLSGVLPGQLEVTVESGPWVPEGGSLTLRARSERIDPVGTAFDPTGRRRLDHIGALVRQPPPGGAGDPAGELNLPLASGGDFSLAEHKGKVVVIDFWASWCGPCRRALPMLSRFAAEARARDLPVVVVTVNTSERDQDPGSRAALAREEREKIGFDLPVLIDLDGSTAARWGVTALPTTVIVSPEGTIAAIHRGAGADYETLLMEEVTSLLEPGG